jgi:hypothetical protein
MNSELATADRLVTLLGQEGFRLQAAVWAIEEEGRGRLYLVPSESRDKLDQTIRVAWVISEHKDELPGRHDLLYSIVDSNNPVVRAVLAAAPKPGKVRGVFSNGTYVDEAYVFPTAA